MTVRSVLETTHERECCQWVRRTAGTILLAVFCRASVVGAQIPPSIDLAQTPADITILGATAYDKTGYSFGTGDFDCDGFVDLVVVSEGQLGSNGHLFAHIFWGDSQMQTVMDLADVLEPVSLIRAGDKEIGTYSTVVTEDLNSDGCDDIVVGIPCRFPFSDCDGKTYIIFGTPLFPDTVHLGSPGVQVTEIFGIPNSNGALGGMIATGNINGDEYQDVVLSAAEMQGGGTTYIILGERCFPRSIHLEIPSQISVRISDPRPTINSGTSIACGDLNQDGFDDVIIGTTDRDELFILNGAPLLPDNMLLASPRIKRIHGAGIGWRVRIAEFNGDGLPDIIASANWFPFPPGCESCGGAVVLYGRRHWPTSIDLGEETSLITRLMGTGITQHFGTVLSSGDVNGDGFEDILLGSRPDRVATEDVGKVTIVLGMSAPPDTILLGTDDGLTRIFAETRTDYFPTGLLAADLNCDNAADILVGATSSAPNGRIAAGKAFIIYGTSSPTGVETPSGMPRLLDVFPNPFSEAISIRFRPTSAEKFHVAIYSVRGSLVRTLLAGQVVDREQLLNWDGTNDAGKSVASGVYFCRLTTDRLVEARKVLLVR